MSRLARRHGIIRVTPGVLPPAPRNRTLAEYAPVFLKWLSFVRQRRENTVRSYGEDLNPHFQFER